MRRINSRLRLATLLAVVVLMLAAGPAFAREQAPGRSASLNGLERAADRPSWSWGASNSGEIKLSDLIVTTQDPDTPGVAPGGGGVVEP
jgi:hypothetical protein